MPNQTAFATPEIERRYREFWRYGGRLFPLTDEEWDFAREILENAPNLKGLDCLLDENYRTLDVGALMEVDLREICTEERIMIAALLAYGTLPNFVRAGWEEGLLEHLPLVGRENLRVLTDALMKLAARREEGL